MLTFWLEYNSVRARFARPDHLCVKCTNAAECSTPAENYTVGVMAWVLATTRSEKGSHACMCACLFRQIRPHDKRDIIGFRVG